MGGTGDERETGGDESKPDGYEPETAPFQGENDAESRPVRDRDEADVWRNRGRNEPDAGPRYDASEDWWDEDDADASAGGLLGALPEAPDEDDDDEDRAASARLRSMLAALRESVRQAPAAPARPGRKWPARTPGSVATPRRRRLRRWGEAARQAAKERIASGGQVKRRSLRAVREAVPMSQSELAEETELSRATISEIERGLRRPQPRTMRLLAEVLRVKVEEIAWP